MAEILVATAPWVLLGGFWLYMFSRMKSMGKRYTHLTKEGLTLADGESVSWNSVVRAREGRRDFQLDLQSGSRIHVQKGDAREAELTRGRLKSQLGPKLMG